MVDRPVERLVDRLLDRPSNILCVDLKAAGPDTLAHIWVFRSAGQVKALKCLWNLWLLMTFS